ncbi:MAG TPA: FtsX-like permease family protein, partial [Thermoanaerobaculia bacterium]|nr:FtsX-like permease family protein [Thermoanaerobaculia bacterium]
ACVAFGVMSLVALQLLSSMIAASIALDPRASLGGDASLSRDGRDGRAGGSFRAEDLAALERIRASGAIKAFNLTTAGGGAILKPVKTGRVHVLGRALGVDPATFPLVGEMRLGGPSAGSFAALISAPGAAVITRDVADVTGLAIGDELILGGSHVGAPGRLRVAGIAGLTPDRQGDSIFYSLATARRLAGREDVVSSAQVLWGPARPAGEKLGAEGWSVATSDKLGKGRARVVDLFGLMLKGAGLLGLLLGGIGVSNTMQVLLARRKLEIATLKTLGYERGHLVILFGLETGMLGTVGGIAGAGAGTGLAVWLRVLLGRMGPIMLGSPYDLRVLAGGVAVGVATAVLFGLQAIARASAVRPSTLLRDLPTPRVWRESALLYAALGVVFSALAAGVMRSVLYGVVVVAVGAVGLALLVALLGAGFFAVVAVPLPLPGIVAIARRNLRRNPLHTLVALVALFCGVFTIGFAGAAIENGRARFGAQAHASQTETVTIYAAPADEGAVAVAFARSDIKARRLDGPMGQVNFSGEVETARLGVLQAALERGAPDALLLSRADLNAATQSGIENLFAFVVAIAGLALVAGGVLIANSVGLAMLERRREMGIFKAIGYSSARILAGIGIEYALLGLVAGVAGMGAVAAAFAIVDRLRPAARLALAPAQAPAMIAVAILIALASAVAVSWRPTHARPLEVLRQEG